MLEGTYGMEFGVHQLGPNMGFEDPEELLPTNNPGFQHPQKNTE
jgi:hypothetical protein